LLSDGLAVPSRLWDVQSGKDPLRLEHQGAVTCAAVLPGDGLAVTSCNDRTLRLWKLRK
jgi:WD40 repeat protein